MTLPLFSAHDIPLWSEPFAGAAAVTLQVIGGRRCHPPVSWMGGKRRLAPAILQRLGLAPGCGARRVMLNDAGPWGWVWPAILDPKTSAAVCRVLRGWADRDIRELWFELRDEGPRVDPAEAVAQWITLAARSANGVPVWWADPDTGEQLHPLPNLDGAWSWRSASLVQGSGEGRRAQPAGQRDPQRTDPKLMASDGRGVIRESGQKGTRAPAQRRGHDAGTDRPADQKGVNAGGCGGLVRIETLAERVEALARALAGRAVDVHHGRAEDIPIPERYEPGSVEYLDPPYRGCTGYGWDVERTGLLDMADRRARAGATVAISEAVPLAAELGPGWEAHDLTRHGNGKPEWLTVWKP